MRRLKPFAGLFVGLLLLSIAGSAKLAKADTYTAPFGSTNFGVPSWDSPALPEGTYYFDCSGWGGTSPFHFETYNSGNVSSVSFVEVGGLQYCAFDVPSGVDWTTYGSPPGNVGFSDGGFGWRAKPSWERRSRF